MPAVETLKMSARLAPAPEADVRAAQLRRELRSVLWQVVALVSVACLVAFFGYNVAVNLNARGLASGFDFLSKEAGFAIGFSLIPFSETDTYARAFVVGLLNTLLVAVVSMVLATLLGVAIGIARVAKHPPTAAAAAIYVECWRNIPLLLQVLFWHQLLVNGLPSVRQSLHLGSWIFLNNRGLVVPSASLDGMPLGPWAVLLAVALTSAALRVAGFSGRLSPRVRALAMGGLGALLAVELISVAVGTHWEMPVLAGFNFRGGLVLVPEFVGLVLALVIYNAAFVAEIVRAGIESVGKGQREAAAALGLSPALTMRLVTLPQAMRVLVPPLANQYSHMLKASSLATVIGYPDLVNVFLGTTLNQTGRAVEIVTLTMAVYLVLSALVAAFTSWFNHRIALVER